MHPPGRGHNGDEVSFLHLRFHELLQGRADAVNLCEIHREIIDDKDNGPPHVSSRYCRSRNRGWICGILRWHRGFLQSRLVVVDVHAGGHTLTEVVLENLEIIRSQIGNLTAMFVQDDGVQSHFFNSNSDPEFPFRASGLPDTVLRETKDVPAVCGYQRVEK